MQKIEISSRTIIFAIFFVLLLKFLWVVHDIIFSLFIAFIIMSALKPYVAFFERNKMPRFLAAVIVYLLFLALFFSTFVLIIPPVITESALLIRAIPSILERFAPNLMTLIDINSLFQFAPDVANRFIDVVRSIFSNTIFFISTLFFGFYLLLEENVIRKIVSRFFSEDKTKTALTVFDKAEKRLSAWFWGEITLMTAVGVLTFIGLNLIGIKYALALAVLAGLLEVVPNLGPTISSIPAILLGFAVSPFMGFTALALYIIVQQLENNLLVPVIMKKAVGLNPIITLIALLIGGKLAGVLGVLLAIPITVFLETIIIELINAPKPNFKSAENLRE